MSQSAHTSSMYRRQSAAMRWAEKCWRIAFRARSVRAAGETLIFRGKMRAGAPTVPSQSPPEIRPALPAGPFPGAPLPRGPRLVGRFWRVLQKIAIASSPLPIRDRSRPPGERAEGAAAVVSTRPLALGTLP